jgi:hypothetical protein
LIDYLLHQIEMKRRSEYQKKKLPLSKKTKTPLTRKSAVTNLEEVIQDGFKQEFANVFNNKESMYTEYSSTTGYILLFPMLQHPHALLAW